MTPRPEVLTISDSDGETPVAKPSTRTPQYRPRDKVSRQKHNSAVVDLTGDEDGLEIVRTAMPNRSGTRSSPASNSLARMYTSPRSHPPAKPRAASPAVSLSDDEDELPDDPTPTTSAARRPPRSDPHSQPKAATSSSSLRNAHHPSSPSKRLRIEDDNVQAHHTPEKRRRVAAHDETFDVTNPHATRSRLPSASQTSNSRPSPSKAPVTDFSSEAGATDESNVDTTANVHGSKKQASMKPQSVRRHRIDVADDRQKERVELHSEPAGLSLNGSAGKSVLHSDPVGARRKRPMENADPPLTDPPDFPKASSRTVDKFSRNNGRTTPASMEEPKEKTAVPASTLSDDDDDQNLHKSVSPLRNSPPPDETSAGASPSSQLHREAGVDLEEPDNGVQAPPEIAVASEEQLDEPELQTIQADAAAEEFAMPELPIFPVERQVERVLGKHYQEMREDTDYFTKTSLKRSRRSIELHHAGQVTAHSDLPSDQPLVASAVFARLRAAATAEPTTSTAKISNDSLRFNVDVYNGVSKPARSYLKAKPIRCNVTSIANDVPEYAHYVSLQTNILAPNTTTMTVWPYFGDGEPDPEEFDNYYIMDTDQRHRKIRRLLEAQKVEEYIDSALRDLHITWDDVLRFLLETNPDVGTNAVARSAILNRDSHREDFPIVQGSKSWTEVLTSLSETTQEKLIKAAILCDNFQRMAKFPIWHVARRSVAVKRIFQAQDLPASSVDSRLCRICFQFNCHQHGELQESYSDTESGAETDDAVAKDILYPLRVNFRKRVSLPSSPPVKSGAGAVSTNATSTKNKKAMKYWDSIGFAEVGEWPPFYPCHHPGQPCANVACSCFVHKRPCEKTCSCEDHCARKFQGCACASFKQRKPGDHVCWRDNKCACYKLGRECDPDLCGTCGVCEVLDPVHRHDHDAIDPMKMCLNASIQKAVPKHTLLGDSGIHGMGLYAGQLIKANEFVGEYKGEVITKEEADRRGAVYERQKSTYLFSLNSRQEVDSNFYGNKIRFINHRNKSGANIYPLIRLVNTVHRIGLFAQSEIKPGEELFFDYGPKFPEHLLGGVEPAVSSKSAPHVRNANMVLNDFYDVEDDEDEAGNRRARKAAANDRFKGRPRKPEPAAKPKGKMGGARPGAGRKPGKKNGEARTASTTAKVAKKAASQSLRITSQDRFEAYYVSQDKDLSVNGDDGDDEDFVDGEASEQESSEEEEASEDEPVRSDKSRYGRERKPGKV